MLAAAKDNNIFAEWYKFQVISTSIPSTNKSYSLFKCKWYCSVYLCCFRLAFKTFVLRSAFSHWIMYNNIGFNEFIVVYTTIFTIQIKVYNTFTAPEHFYVPIPKHYFSCLSQCMI